MAKLKAFSEHQNSTVLGRPKQMFFKILTWLQCSEKWHLLSWDDEEEYCLWWWSWSVSEWPGPRLYHVPTLSPGLRCYCQPDITHHWTRYLHPRVIIRQWKYSTISTKPPQCLKFNFIDDFYLCHLLLSASGWKKNSRVEGGSVVDTAFIWLWYQQSRSKQIESFCYHCCLWL